MFTTSQSKDSVDKNKKKKEMNEKLLEELEANECIIMEGYDDALIGISYGIESPSAVYDLDLCIESLINKDNMTEEDAEEFFVFNTLNCYVGEKTIIFLKTYEKE
tara:strand:+ start:16 stop:330 length:315 start_codon:yes stop_codon:yes gene_type:complete